uniref:Tc1-like transposase DDE domain-containing protein n=1 Tax=Cyprinus carpio carpio TaxID=630221 RepID=A0A9J7ZP51_CYPCA
MSFGNQGARVWRKTGEKEMPKCLKSSVKYPQSVMVWGAMSAAGVGPLCFIKGRVNAASYQEILEHFMLPSAEKLYGDEDFVFQHDLAPAHSAKTTGKWFTDHGITVLNWPANSPDLNPIENLWDYGVQVRRVGRPIEHSNTMVSKPFTSSFGTVSRCQVVLKNKIFISIKLFSRWKHEVLQNLLIASCIDPALDKTQWTNTSS